MTRVVEIMSVLHARTSHDMLTVVKKNKTTKKKLKNHIYFMFMTHIQAWILDDVIYSDMCHVYHCYLYVDLFLIYSSQEA